MSKTKTSTSEGEELARSYLDRADVRAFRGAATSEAQKAVMRDAYSFGQGFALDGKHVPAEQVLMSSEEIAAEQDVKTSSPELATLAAKYVNLSDYAMVRLFNDGLFSQRELDQFVADVQSLAASVLGQAAPK